MAEKIISNIVCKQTLRPIQQKILDDLAAILKNSFGPMGSNTCIKKENALNVYTKDGHTILKSIYYNGIIEQSIKDDIESITRHIVATVGDGTTSAVILADCIFASIAKMEEKGMMPVRILNLFERCVSNIKQAIKNEAKDCTIDDIYDISMISTNGNEFISKTIYDIYKEYGLDIFIDVAASVSGDTVIKTYDGMTLNTGFSDACYVTDSVKNECIVDNPNIYFFEHPIDTREMAVYLDAILSNNIYSPIARKEPQNVIPTVIVAPKISQDMSSVMDSIVNYMGQMPAGQKPPLLVITNYHQDDIIMDIAKLCDAKTIRKYIDGNILEEDIKNGNAPTPETIIDWCGHADRIVANTSKTSFINPCNYKDENGELSTMYTNMIKFYESELSRAKENGEDATSTGSLKRHIHALKSSLVELNIGGISQADRDSLRDLVEDAVLNCRSAALNGVGYGANYMGLKASYNDYIQMRALCVNNNDRLDNIEEMDMYESIFDAYSSMTTQLYKTVVPKDQALDIVVDSITNGCPMNLINGTFDKKVKSSIESDIIILDSIEKIVGLMATCNQFCVPSPMHNIYEKL